MRNLLIISCIFLSHLVSGQINLRGKVTNTRGEALEFAVVFLEGSQWAAATDQYGNYVISGITAGNYKVKVTHTTYQTFQDSISFTNQDVVRNFVMPVFIYELQSLQIVANKMTQKDPFRFSVLNSDNIPDKNTGTDLPTLIQNTASVLVTSDAGNGIGYSSLSIRGSDQTRINVNINGVPVNDAESQNVFWVNMPDLSSSTQSIQIQRGVGASTNGPGAFGGSVLLDTKSFHQNPYINLSGSLGSFMSSKGSIALGTGLMNDRYYVEGRYSHIQSDGYIDRAESKLSGIFFTAGRITEKSSLRFQMVFGKEITYQAWNGVPESKVFGNEEDLRQHYDRNLGSIYKSRQDSVNLFSSDRRYNYYTYENQVDNYRQSQAQLSYNREINKNISFQTTGFYTFGTGYFEQFRYDDPLEDYGFTGVTDMNGNEILSGDLARRRWLRNHFYGILTDIKGSFHKRHQWQAGVFISKYDGQHFGEIVKTWFDTDSPILSKYYDNNGLKKDASVYVRYSGNIGQNIQLYGDVQLRGVDYSINGLLDDRQISDLKNTYLFFNPKAGFTMQLGKKNELIASWAVAHREPARSDFTDHIGVVSIPKPERMFNYEVAFRRRTKSIQIQTGIYFMDYRNQLVLNGNLNDVGAPLRINVPKSYRLGWETEASIQVNKVWELNGNVTLSRNRILDFKEVIYDYTNGFDIVVKALRNTPISYSPAVITSLEFIYKPIKNLSVSWTGKYVSQQFLDNTGKRDRIIPDFHIHALRASYVMKPKFCKELTFNLLIQNLFNRKYVNSGYTYSYIYEQPVTENFYFPQAGIHGFGGFEVKF
jgi:iron complex outermembrane receptor protein